jgi:hypothetical protein
MPLVVPPGRPPFALSASATTRPPHRDPSAYSAYLRGDISGYSAYLRGPRSAPEQRRLRGYGYSVRTVHAPVAARS